MDVGEAVERMQQQHTVLRWRIFGAPVKGGCASAVSEEGVMFFFGGGGGPGDHRDELQNVRRMPLPSCEPLDTQRAGAGSLENGLLELRATIWVVSKNSFETHFHQKEG